MKGYRTPSWFRMKGFRDKKQAKIQISKPRKVKSEEPAKKRND